jgi:pilus assembly protein CpaE
MADEIISLRLKVKNEKIKEEFAGIISSLAGFKIQNSDDPSSFDLLILEIGDDLNKEFELIHSLHNSEKEVFLTSTRTEPEMLIQALRTGAKEFFAQPINRDEVKGALLRFRQRKESPKGRETPTKNGKLIDVFGSKGGVGTTTVAVNLATSLAELEGKPKVALIDMNLLFGEIPLFLDVDSAFNWEEVARNIARLDSTYLMSILTKHSSGIYVLPSPTGLDLSDVATPEIIQKILRMMQGVFDFIVIDSGQSLDDISLKILELSNTVFLIAILSVPCLINIKRLQDSFRKLGYPHDEDVKIIINRYQKKSMISLEEAEQSINQKIFWHIPNDYTTTMSAINQGKSLFIVARGSEITTNFRDLATTFLVKAEEEKEKRKVPFWTKVSQEG